MPGVRVFDGGNNFVAEYDTIQAANNAASTLDGYRVLVVAEDYSPVADETVVVTKELVIETDVNGGVDPNTGVRGDEVVVDRFDIQASNATIDGFTVSGASNDERIEVSNSADDVTIVNNIVVQDGSRNGVDIDNQSTGVSVAGNRIEQNHTQHAVNVEGAADIDGNTIVATGNGVRVYAPDGTYSVTDNTIQSSTPSSHSGILVYSTSYTGTVSGNSVTFTDPSSAGIGLNILNSTRNLTVEDNIAFAGGQWGILVDPGSSSFDQSGVVIGDDLSIFSGQSDAVIVLTPQAVANGVTVDEAALTATGATFASTDGFDSINSNYDDGAAWFLDLQSAIDGSLDLATIALSSNYGAAGSIDITREGLTIDAPTGVTGTLTLDTGIYNVSLAGEGDLDITGNTLDNRINGNDGNNTINAGDGADRVNGGGGADTIDAGAGDDLVFYDAADNPADVTGGDDDDTLVIVGGSVPVSYDLAAGSFESALWQQEGSETDLWYYRVTQYAQNWQPVSRATDNDDGSSQVLLWDWEGSQIWSVFVRDYNSAGEERERALFNDDDTKLVTLFDPGDAAAWSSFVREYDDSGQETERALHYDDTARTVTLFDPAAGELWSSFIRNYDSSSQETDRALYNDDGTSIVTLFDLADAQSWDQFIRNYNASSQETDRALFNDDGTSVVTVFDVADTQSWDQWIRQYDDEGNLVDEVYV